MSFGKPILTHAYLPNTLKARNPLLCLVGCGLVIMSYPLDELTRLSVRIQELLGDYHIESITDIVPKRTPDKTREEEFEERSRGYMVTSGRFMKKAGTELLPQIQSVLAEIESLLESEDKSIASRVRPILENAQRFATNPTNPLGYNELSALLMRLKGQLSMRVIIRPTVFVGFRYTQKDEIVANKLIELFQLEDLNPISGKTAKAEDVDEKIKSMIDVSDGVLIIFTKEKELKHGGWATSTWLTSESAYALGQKKQVGLFFEDCISPTQRKGIQGDLEYIKFNREHLDKTFLEAIPYLKDFRQRILGTP